MSIQAAVALFVGFVASPSVAVGMLVDNAFMTALTLWLQWRRSRVVALLLCGFLAFLLLTILPTLAMGIGRLFPLGMMLVALWAAIRAARATQRLAADAEPDAGAV